MSAEPEQAGDTEPAPEPAGWRAEDAPRLHPTTYPGAWPDRSILLLDQSRHVAVDLLPGSPVGAALVLDGGAPADAGLSSGRPAAPRDEVLRRHASLSSSGRPAPTLDEVLRRHSGATIAGRTPVLAVGSNASPAQLRWKLGESGTSVLVPLVQVEVDGLAVGLAGRISRNGTVPATPIFDPEVSARLFVQWLDADQLAAIDRTEGGYERRTVEADEVQVVLPSGGVLDRCDVYVSQAGHLVDETGPLPLGDQLVLVEDLLARSAALRDLVGDTAPEWFARLGREPDLADQVRAVFVDEGWVS